MDKKIKQIYSSNDGYWRGKSAIQKLSQASGSTKEETEGWLIKQPLYQIYLPHQNIYPGLMRVCHYMLHQTISIRQTFSIYHMTNTKRKYIVCFKYRGCCQ